MTNFSVAAYDQEPFERLLRRFSTKTKRSGILRDLKNNRFYVKPSVQKKLDHAKGIRRMKKAEKMAQMSTTAKKKLAEKKKARRGHR